MSPAGQQRSCCKANGGHDHGGEEYSFGVALDPDLPGTEGSVFQSFRTIELVLDSTEKERSGLAVRRMKRLLAPASQENPVRRRQRHLLFLVVRYHSARELFCEIDACLCIPFGCLLWMYSKTR